MPFSPAVKARIFVRCARICCLCFKQCGTCIEAAHIVAEADGGPNDDENAIPLCFDCHEEIGSYNPRHPKGNKFTPEELVQRRDALYQLVDKGIIQGTFQQLTEALTKLGERADMQGEIVIMISPHNPYQDQTRIGSLMEYSCDCCNHGKVPCEISKVRVHITPPNGAWFEDLRDLVPQVVGPGRVFRSRESYVVSGVSPRDLRQSQISVILVDSLGARYQNTVTKISPALLIEGRRPLA